jgi:hypothetical protein
MSKWSLEYTFDVDLKQAIIREKIFGIWKESTARQYHEDFQEEVAQLIERPWAKLVDLSNWKTSYPQVITLIGEHLDWCRRHNLALSVNVLNNPSTFRQLNEMFGVGKTKPLSQVFRTMSDAEKYLAEHWFKQNK